MIAERFDVVPLMSADVARAAVTTINRHFASARALLVDLYEQRGWAALGYTSWRMCVLSEFAESESTLYRALTAGQIERNLQDVLSDLGKIVPESQLLALKDLPPAAQPVAWKRAERKANDAGERLSARHLAAAAQDSTPTTDLPEEKTEAMTDRPTRFTTGMRSSDSDAWFTPERILIPVRAVLSSIDLDPCSNEEAQQNVQARRYYTEADDGLSQPWHSDTIFLNPPYGRTIGAWTDRLIRAYTSGETRAALALLPGRTDTDWFTPLFAYPICFVHGRLTFSGYAAGAPFPSVVVYLGPDEGRFVRHFADLGPVMASYRTSNEGYNPQDIRTPGHAALTSVTA